MPPIAAAVLLAFATPSACGHHDCVRTHAKPLCLMRPAIPFDQDALDTLSVEEMRVRSASRGAPDTVIRSRAAASGLRGTGFTLQFNVFGTTNADTQSAMQLTADYYASLLDDPITVVIDIEFDPGFFGGASPAGIEVGYDEFLAALRADADADDTIQDLLPDGTLPARRTLGGGITQETILLITTANAKALGLLPANGPDADANLFVGSLPDGDPSDGIGNGAGGGFFGEFSLTDILVHEVGHALGFINVIEFGGNEPTTLDAFRFQRTGDGNPGNASEFTTFPRALWVGVGSDAGQHAFDFIDSEYLASNASNFQASHFEETGAFPLRIGVMEPAIAPFETGFPDYFSQADRDVFDAIGYDIVEGTQPCNTADLASPFGTLDLRDIVAFVDGFVALEPLADLAPPAGVFDLNDIDAFVTAFNAGCP